MTVWKWVVRLTYNEGVVGTKAWKRGARPGDLVIETKHKNDASKDIEVAAAGRRKDVDVAVYRCGGWYA